jgi:hypothetical protein
MKGKRKNKKEEIDMKEKEEIEMKDMRSSFKFPFQRTLRVNWQMSLLRLPNVLGGECRHFFVKGKRTLEFTASERENCANIRVVDFELILSKTVLSIGHPSMLGKKPIYIPDLQVNQNDLKLNGIQGIVNLQSGQFSLKLELMFPLHLLPGLKNYKIPEKLPVSIWEIGRLRVGEFDKCKSLIRFRQKPSVWDLPRIPKSFFFWDCTGTDCSTEGYISANLTGDPIDPRQQGHNEVEICPGEPVHLWWGCSKDVTSNKCNHQVLVQGTSTTNHICQLNHMHSSNSR